DLVISMSFIGLAAGVFWFVLHRLNISRGQQAFAWMLCAFLLLAAASQFSEIATLWYPFYGVQGFVKAASAAISVVTVAFRVPILPDLVNIPSAQQLANANSDLRRQTATVEQLQRDFEAERGKLKANIEELNRAHNLTKARFETALRGADIYCFSQDSELRYT